MTSQEPKLAVCPACGGDDLAPAFRRVTTRNTNPEGHDLRPTATGYGWTLGRVLRCRDCGHGSLSEPPSSADLLASYAHVLDSWDEIEQLGRIATARRDLARVRSHLDAAPGQLLDIGCWTGALVEAARGLGWDAVGLEPSGWAVERASERGLAVRQGVIGDDDGLTGQRFQVIACCDVLEHLLDPSAALGRVAELLEPGGLFFATVPDFGSSVARALGSRWWSVLPMHVQYFTRRSLGGLVSRTGLTALEMSTHPKVFPRRYYGDRLGEFVPLVGPLVSHAVRRTSGSERPIGPDFRDRLALVARKSRVDR